MMKTKLLIAMALASTQAMAAPHSVTHIVHSAKVSANDDNPSGLNDEVTLRGDNEATDFTSGFQASASSKGASATLASSLASEFNGRYTGTVSARCESAFLRPAGSHSGGLWCYGRWDHTLRNTGPGKIKVAMGGFSTKSSAAEEAWRVSYITARLSVSGAEDDTVRHSNGEFVNGQTSISVAAHPQYNAINFSFGNGPNGGIPAQSHNAQFSFRWIVEAGAYRLNAESDSDSLPGVEQVIDGADTVYQLESRKKVVSEFLPVDIQADYQLSGRFKSLDEDLSQVYFGIESYDENFQLIESYMVNRFGQNYVISSAASSELIVFGMVNDWAAVDDPAHKRAIGIYFDGDTNKRPDHYVMYDASQLYSTDPAAGAYRAIDGGRITLSQALPDDVLDAIIPGVTVVKNHRQSSSHIYLYGADVPQQWTGVQGQLSGTAWLNRHDAFRPQTRYVKIYVAGNWQGGATEALMFDDLVLEKVQ